MRSGPPFGKGQGGASVCGSQVLCQLLSKEHYTTLKVGPLSHARLFVTPRAGACQAPPSMGCFQARKLEWVAISFSRGSSQPRDGTQVSHTAGRLLNRLSHHGSVYPHYHATNHFKDRGNADKVVTCYPRIMELTKGRVSVRAQISQTPMADSLLVPLNCFPRHRQQETFTWKLFPVASEHSL